MIRIAICQCGSTGTPEENSSRIVSLFEEAATRYRNLDLIVFPEYAYYAPANAADAVEKAIDLSAPNDFLAKMCELARTYRVNCIPGSFAARTADRSRVTNTCVVIDRAGRIAGRYDKTHLMVAASYDESAYVSYGKARCVVDLDFARIGLMVCYDLRFPELARTMCLEGAQILVVPAMFPLGRPLPPRVDDWDILVQSTALTNATYVAACNQFGTVCGDTPFGRSCIVDPRGVKIAQASGGETIFCAELDPDYQERCRNDLGIWKNRRPELYWL